MALVTRNQCRVATRETQSRPRPIAAMPKASIMTTGCSAQWLLAVVLIMCARDSAAADRTLWSGYRGSRASLCAAWDTKDGHFFVVEVNTDVYSYHALRRGVSARPGRLCRSAVCVAQTHDGVTIVTQAGGKSTVASYQLAVERSKTSRSVQLKLVNQVPTAWPVTEICEVQPGKQNAATLVCCFKESPARASNCGFLNRKSGSLSVFASSLDKGELMAASSRVLAVSDWSQIHVFNWNETPTPKVSHIDLPAARQISVSPDGAFVAVSRRVAGDHDIRIYSSLSGTLASSVLVPQRQKINSLAWVRDSRSLIVGTSRLLDKRSTEGSVFLFRELEGQPVTLATSTFGYCSVVSTHSAVIAGTLNGEVQLVELPDGTVRPGQ